jgi:hypothetical protein
MTLCLECYRAGKGCLHWFGFGQASSARWKALKGAGTIADDAEPPHILAARRFLRPRASEGGAEGRHVLTTEDPVKRLQSGCFCMNCLACANECFWQCQSCNDGEWGFCNNCVNQGKVCSHPLLALVHKPRATRGENDASPADSSVVFGVDGPLEPLTFRVGCDICHRTIMPTSTRFHCYQCTSSLLNDHQAGDYDMCTACYAELVAHDRISADNGPGGWRRCLQGHRMVLVGFVDGARRVVQQDLVGGVGLSRRALPAPAAHAAAAHAAAAELWLSDQGRHQRLATLDVAATPPSSWPQTALAPTHPPDGGFGARATARWAWFPPRASAADRADELCFPRGALITECVDLNGDWLVGVYMGQRRLLPAPYVQIAQ